MTATITMPTGFNKEFTFDLILMGYFSIIDPAGSVLYRTYVVSGSTVRTIRQTHETAGLAVFNVPGFGSMPNS